MVSTRIAKGSLVAVILFILYVGSYLIFRAQCIERWERDGKEYLIFPAGIPIVYYLFRPLAYVDGKMTGLRFHIGPHR